MKIAVTGTHSTGKTTLAEAIAKEYNYQYVRGDKAIQIVKENFPNKPINELTTEDQWLLQQKMFESFDEALNVDGNVVSDGLHLTCIPYGLKYTNGEMTKMPGYIDFIHKVIEQTKKFDKIIYIPPEIGLEDDNFRPLETQLRIDIDSDIYDFLEDLNFRTVTGTVEERVRTVGQELGFKSKWKNYIAFEGLPRSGKSSQIELLKQRAKSEGKKLFQVVRNDNEYMREMKARYKLDPYVKDEELLTLGAKALKYDIEVNNIEERLDDGYVVISDRQKFTSMTLSSLMDIPRYRIYTELYGVVEPGKVIYVDTNPALSVTRSKIINPHKELKTNVDFQKSVRNEYDKLSKQHNFVTVPANLTPGEMHEIIYKNVFEGENK